MRDKVMRRLKIGYSKLEEEKETKKRGLNAEFAERNSWLSDFSCWYGIASMCGIAGTGIQA
jgi:hypothetical protein